MLFHQSDVFGLVRSLRLQRIRCRISRRTYTLHLGRGLSAVGHQRTPDGRSGQRGAWTNRGERTGYPRPADRGKSDARRGLRLRGLVSERTARGRRGNGVSAAGGERHQELDCQIQGVAFPLTLRGRREGLGASDALSRPVRSAKGRAGSGIQLRGLV